jgi:hypothetical protein
VHLLFHILPGGDIQATHSARKAAAQLSPNIVGEILVAFARYTAEPDTLSGSATKSSIHNHDDDGRLYKKLLHILNNHPDGQMGRQDLVQQVEMSQSALQALHLRERQSQPIRQKIKSLEGDVIKASKNKIKRIRTAFEMTVDTEKRALMEQEIAQLEQNMEAAKQEVEQLREQIVTSLHKKVARKNLKRAQDAVREEEDDRRRLAKVLTESFCAYDLSPNQAKFTTLFSHATTAILSTFLWMKYDTLTALSGYFECMEIIGALNVSVDELMQTINTEASSMEHSETTSESGSDRSAHETSMLPSSLKRNSSNKVSDNKFKMRKRPARWDGRDLANAAVVVITKPGSSKRPQIIPFNYGKD